MVNTNDWTQARNVLCVRLDTIGDVLMTTPAIRAVKESYPGRCITLLTSPAAAEVSSLIPEVDKVIIYDAPWMKSYTDPDSSRQFQTMVSKLKRLKFDASVIFTVYSQNPLPSALLCYLAHIPLRLAHCHENPYRLLTHWVKDPEPESFIRHEVRRQLALVSEIGCSTSHDERLSLSIPEGSMERVLEITNELAIKKKKPWVVIHPGATASSRRYPPEHFAAVARALVTRIGCEVIFTGLRSEQELVEYIRSIMKAPSYSLAGQLNLGELTALIHHVPLLISNNTAPVHIAASVGTKVIDIYAQTNPQHTPWNVPNRVLTHEVSCKNCYKSACPEGHHHCLKKIQPEKVVQAAYELLCQTEVK